MQYVIYGGTRVLASDAAAAATLSYCAALSQSGLSDVVAVPTPDEFGCGSTVSILLGPGLPLMAVTAPDDILETDDHDFVQDLNIRTAAAVQGIFAQHS
jgi:hypothetical protein